MPEMRFCPMCGSKLPPDAPSGMCPQCLLQQGLEESIPGDSASRSATIIGGGFVPPTPEELNEHFPQLEVIELIGKGGMGAVYKARQPSLDRMVALKVLPPEIGDDAAFAERFTREARALAKLSHQNIVGVFDFGQTAGGSARVSDPAVATDRRSPVGGETFGRTGGSVGDRPQQGLFYFLMEYVDGTNLRDLIHNKSLTAKEALAIVPQICEALEFAHDEGIVHRDIKPENILVDKRGRVKIADFGLAKLLQAEQAGVTLTQAGQVMGTWYYMAPEQIERPLEVDHRADIYSLGVVFYEMLTGEVPAGRFELPSKKTGGDARLDDVVLRSLERDPGQRYQRASHIKTEVETIAGISNIAALRMFGREYRTKTRIFGIPLVHIAYGIDPVTGRQRTAKGIIAIGERAVGGLAIGGVAFGGIAVGGFGIGMISISGFAIAMVLAMGGLAIGGAAFGGGAIGFIAIGGGAVGYYAFGGGAWGVHAIGGNANDPGARAFFLPWALYWHFALAMIGIGAPIVACLMWTVLWFVFRAQEQTIEIESPPTPHGDSPGDADASRQLRGPGIGLVLTGILNWIGIPVSLLVIQNHFADELPSQAVIGTIAVVALIASGLMIAAGFLMMRCRGRALAKFGSILAMLVSPGNLLGLPIGIWSLVVLSQREVKAAFRDSPDA